MDLSGDRSRLDMYFAGLQQRAAYNSHLHSISSPASQELATSDDPRSLLPVAPITPGAMHHDGLCKAQSTPPLKPDDVDCRQCCTDIEKAESSPAGLDPGCPSSLPQQPAWPSCEEHCEAGGAAGASTMRSQPAVEAEAAHATAASAKLHVCATAGSKSQAATHVSGNKSSSMLVPSQHPHDCNFKLVPTEAAHGSAGGSGKIALQAAPCAASGSPAGEDWSTLDIKSEPQQPQVSQPAHHSAPLESLDQSCWKSRSGTQPLSSAARPPCPDIAAAFMTSDQPDTCAMTYKDPPWQHAGLECSSRQMPGLTGNSPADPCRLPHEASQASQLLLDAAAHACRAPSSLCTHQQLPRNQDSSCPSEGDRLGSRPAKRPRLTSACKATIALAGSRCPGPSESGRGASSVQPMSSSPSRSSSAQQQESTWPCQDATCWSGPGAGPPTSVEMGVAAAEGIAGVTQDGCRLRGQRQPQLFGPRQEPALMPTAPRSSWPHSAAGSARNKGDQGSEAAAHAWPASQTPTHGIHRDAGTERAAQCMPHSWANDNFRSTGGLKDVSCCSGEAQVQTLSQPPSHQRDMCVSSASVSSFDTAGGAGPQTAVDAGSEFVDLTLIDPRKQARLLAAIQREATSPASSGTSSRTSPMHCRQFGLMKQAKMQAFFRFK